jgi:hypothetical protein
MIKDQAVTLCLYILYIDQQHVIVDFHRFDQSSIQPDPAPAADPSIMNVTPQQVLGHISEIEQAIRNGIREKNIKAVMKEKKSALVSGYIISDQPCHSHPVENIIWLEKADSHGRRAGSLPGRHFFVGICGGMVQFRQDRGRRFS